MTLVRRDAVALLLVTGLAALSWLPRLRGPIDLRWDAGAYYVLGTALAEGKGYRLLNEPGEIQSTLHPPMLPLMFAAFQLAVGTSDFVQVGGWLRRVYFVLFLGYAAAVYVMLRRLLSPNYAVPAALVCVFQLYTVYMSDTGFPELPFTFVTLMFVLSAPAENTRRVRFLAAPLAIMAFALRTVGVAALAAWVADSACRRQFKQAAIRTVVALLPVVGWAGYVLDVESSQEYQNPRYGYQRAPYNYLNVSYARNVAYKDPFSPELGLNSPADRARQVLVNGLSMPLYVAEAISARESIWDLFRTELNSRLGAPLVPPFVRPLLLALAACCAAGLVLQWLRGQLLVPLLIVFSLAMVCITPWPGQFNRYLTPFVPFLSLSFFFAVQSGASWSSRWLPTRFQAVGAWVGALLATAALGCQAATIYALYTKWHPRVEFTHRNSPIAFRSFFYEGSHRATDAGLDWLNEHADGRGVIAATDPQWAYLRTGLKSVLPPFEIDSQKAQRLLDSVPIRYLIVDDSVYSKYTIRVAQEQSEKWRRVYDVAFGAEGGSKRTGTVAIFERVDTRPDDAGTGVRR
jgi:hypothetical protein